MDALPPDLDDNTVQTTGVSCPDCCGVLAVHAEGRELLFKCRIGHTYDVSELLSAKEEVLDGRLWAAVTGFEELAVLLRDLATRQDAGGAFATSFPERAARARAAAAALRDIVRINRPVDLVPVEPGPSIA